MADTRKFLLVPRDRFREFLVRLINSARTADDLLAALEKTLGIIELQGKDRLVKLSDVQEALRTKLGDIVTRSIE